MSQRRGKSEGTIFRRANGSWRAQVTVGGKRLSFTGLTQTECRQWIRETHQKIQKGLSYANSKITFAEFLEDWLQSIQVSLRPGTLKQYRQVVQHYIAPDLGLVKVVELRAEQIQHLYGGLVGMGKGRRTVQVVHAVIHRSLNQAIRLGVLSMNPASSTTPPKPEQIEMKVLDEGQVQKLLIAAEAKGFRFLAFYYLAISVGMRQGELLGLKWEDIDFRKQTIKVVRQSKQVHGGGFEFTQPKTKSGNRTIAFGPETANILKRHYLEQLDDRKETGEAWKDYDLVFPSVVGSPQNPTNVVRSFKLLISALGLPKIRFHDLRHTAASLMLNNGVDVLVVSRRLGHSKPSVTLDIYGHLISRSQERASELIEELITPINVSFAPTAPELHQIGGLRE